MMDYVIIDSRWVIDAQLVNLSAVAAASIMHAVPTLHRVAEQIIVSLFYSKTFSLTKTQMEVVYYKKHGYLEIVKFKFQEF